MEYEAYEPNPGDEYYDQMCAASYAAMFNSGRSEYHAGNNYEYHPPVYGDICRS